MDPDEYYDLLESGGGQGFCSVCLDDTFFTVDEYGDLVCASCGNEPELDEPEDEEV